MASSENKLWPLPADYHDLTEEGRRLARVAACSMHTSPEAYVYSWAFFRDYYLNPNNNPEAYFYDEWSEPSPKHYEWAYCRRKYARNVIAAHRGSAKSTIRKEFHLQTLLTEPHSKQLVLLADDSKVERNFDDLMQQLEHNPRIVGDFGRMRPDKNEGIWNRHQIRLTNGAQLLGYSAQSRNLRGERPKYLYIDDIERDLKETGSSNIEKIMEDMETLIFSVLLPMLRRTASLYWIGTPTSRRLYLWKFITGEDPRIDVRRWNRRIYEMYDSAGKIFWESEWTPDRIEAAKRELGHRWEAEGMCRPGAGGDKILIIPEASWYGDPNEESPAREPDPLQSVKPVKYTDISSQRGQKVTSTPRVVPAGTLYNSMYRFITVDYAWTANPSSDRSVVHVLGADRNGQIWSLDLWSDRVTKNTVIRKIWELAMKWKVRLCGVESVAVQFDFFRSVHERGLEIYSQHGWAPQVVEIKYQHGVEKSDRIAGLSWLLNVGRIKIPRWKRNPPNDPYDRLQQQIVDFTEDLGLLQHDDEVDTLAMYQEIIKSPRRAVGEVSESKTPADYIRNGQLVLPGGIPACTLDIGTIPSDLVQDMMNRETGRRDHRVHWTEGGL